LAFLKHALSDQRGLIAEDRVSGEVLEGHRSVEDDRQLQNGTRCAAEVGKVIPPDRNKGKLRNWELNLTAD